jgi:hypothetical protein
VPLPATIADAINDRAANEVMKRPEECRLACNKREAHNFVVAERAVDDNSRLVCAEAERAVRLDLERRPSANSDKKFDGDVNRLLSENSDLMDVKSRLKTVEDALQALQSRLKTLEDAFQASQVITNIFLGAVASPR